MQPRKIKPEPNLTEATEKTGLLIRGLQSRLLDATAEAQEVDTTTDLENQLQEYFAGWPGEQGPGAGSLNRIRNRVIEGVVDRILRGWQQDGKGNPIEKEVIERLIERVLDSLIASGAGPGLKARSFSSGPKSATLSGNQM